MTRRLAAALTIIGSLMLGGCGNDYGVDQHGQKVEAQRLDKQWKVVNYWAQWCAPCRTEIPELNALAEQLKGHPVEVFGVDFDGTQGALLSKSSEELGIKFTVLAQDPAPFFALPRSQALPATYIIDDKGKLREQLLGEQTAAGLMQKLKDLQALN